MAMLPTSRWSVCLCACFVAVLACTPPAALGPVRILPGPAIAQMESAPASYSARSRARLALDDDESDEMREVFEGALSEETRRTLKHDPALDAVAAVVARTRFESGG